MAGVKFNSIQMGRAAAALMVVVLHSGAVAEKVIGHEPRIANALNFGFAGVDLFFVISGFIISLVTDDGFPDQRDASSVCGLVATV
jgi:peptidoglycan/LPS O-acetylase OafA/YrhL